MNAKKTAYLYAVAANLPRRLDRRQTLAELESHIDEAICQLMASGLSEQEATSRALSELGSPLEVANGFRGIRPFSADYFSRAMLLQNGLLFLGGILVLAVQAVWGEKNAWPLFSLIAQYKTEILIGYATSWLAFGYCLGQRYGVTAERHMKKMVRLPLTLNYLFMFLVLLQVLPRDWFGPLLTTPFLIACAAATLLFSSLAGIGCRWGRQQMRLD
ncbi:permease prefix domain 1-containing protein [Brevibacillus sp. B_LB10_24]|uniref:permease prefix domain 1-containing protein n=1 Tax=Brevibacillus sp. B_LB10_24 TaxID=3380645 RepID=UPI0038B8A218